MKKVLLTLLVLLTLTTTSYAENKVFTTQYVKGKRTIRIQDGEYNGVYYIDMREVYTDKNGKERFTKKGFAIKKEQVKDMIRALGKFI